MTKYHVRPNGSIGVCNAQHKCRYAKYIHVNANSPEEAQQQVDDFNKIIARFSEPGGTITEERKIIIFLLIFSFPIFLATIITAQIRITIIFCINVLTS